MDNRVTEFVFSDGKIRYIHSDDAAEVGEMLGEITTRRASHVEPGPGGVWLVDLRPVGGPELGPFPPAQREAALEAERAWLRENWLYGSEPVGLQKRGASPCLCRN